MVGQESSQRLRIGTSGYSYPGPPPKGWSGVFYPQTKGKRFNELEYYSSFFNAVEINSTFYRPPAPTMAGAWVTKAPAHFQFAIKAWQKFTHAKKVGGESRDKEETWKSPTHYPKARIFVFLNNHARGQAVANGLMLMHEVGQEVPAGLPSAMMEAYPQLAAFARMADQNRLF